VNASTVALGALLLIGFAYGLRLRRVNLAEATELAEAIARAERDLAAVRSRRSLEHTFSRELELATDASDAMELLQLALLALDSSRPFELHLVDPTEATLRLAFATGAAVSPVDNISAWVSEAAREGETKLYRSTTDPRTCAHLQSRLIEHCSAVAIPLVAAGRVMGLLYAFGPLNVVPSTDLVHTYEAMARATAAALAALDIEAHHEQDAAIDLVDEPAIDLADDRVWVGSADDAEGAIDERLAGGQAFAVILLEIDAVVLWREAYGEYATTSLTRAVATIAADMTTADNSLFEIDNDRVLVVIDGARARDALRSAEHIRDRVHEQFSEHFGRPVTISAGVLEAHRHMSTEQLRYGVTDALYNARAQGPGSVVLGLASVADLA
jgi:GGDEF domain-containing protein